MKRILVLTAAVAFLFSACKKEKGESNLHVTVLHEGARIGFAAVYLAKDDTASPAHYDRMRGADAMGEVYFEKLPEGNYFIYAEGNASDSNNVVRGSAHIVLVNRNRMNEERIIVHTK